MENDNTVAGKSFSKMLKIFEIFWGGGGKEQSSLSYLDSRFGEYVWPLEEAWYLEMLYEKKDFYDQLKRYLEEKIKLPTAFMADNDMIALGAMKAMAEYGVRIPEEVSVIGFDDLPFSAISSPPLTTLRVPKQEIGRIATRRLIQMIKERQEAGVKIEVSTQFVERGSVKTIK